MPIDYKRYPANWKTYIVPTVLARAKNCCEACGLKNHCIVFAIKLWVRDELRYKLRTIWFRDERDASRESEDVSRKRVVLTIAHLDHDETNESVSLHRLKALCQLCHLRYDAEEKYRRSLETWKQQERN